MGFIERLLLSMRDMVLMKKYYALVHGRNFDVSVGGVREKVGFFSTFIFSFEKEGSDFIGILNSALKERLDRNGVYQHSSGFIKSYATLASLSEVELNLNENMDGFTFYKMNCMDAYLSMIYKHLILRFSSEIVLESESRGQSEPPPV